MPECDKPLRHEDGNTILTGTADLAEYNASARQVRGLDFKTGWLETDATMQVKGYAFLLLKAYEDQGCESVWFGTLHTRNKVLIGQQWTAIELEQWWAWLCDHLAAQIYRPSFSACTHCHRWAECEAGAMLARTAAAQLIDLDEADALDTLSPETAVKVLEQARYVEKRAALARELVKVYVAKTGESTEDHGPRVTAEDGAYLELSKVERRKITLTMPAAGVLRRAIGDDIHKLNVGVGQVEDLVSEHSPRGQKKILVQRTMDELETAGALSTEVSDRLDYRPARKQIGAKV